MGWTFMIVDENENIPEVKASSFYLGANRLSDPVTGLPIVGLCQTDVTYNYGQIFRELGLVDSLWSFYDREVNEDLALELFFLEVRLESMCEDKELTNDIFEPCPTNVLKFIRWFREIAEILSSREGKFICKVY